MISRSADQLSLKFDQQTTTITAWNLFDKNFDICKKGESDGGQKFEILPKIFFSHILTFFIFLSEHFSLSFSDYENLSFVTMTPIFKTKSIHLWKIVFGYIPLIHGYMIAKLSRITQYRVPHILGRKYPLPS